MDDSLPHLRYLVIGKLNRNYTVLPDGQVIEDSPGGSALYASAGAAVWETGIGIVARVGSDYPDEWISNLTRWNIDQRGVRRISEPLDMREFSAYSDLENRHTENPVSHFARLNLPFPKSLLGYTPAASSTDSRTRPNLLTIRGSDFPSDYLDATAAHICPMDFLSHTLLPPTLRQGHINTITLDPGEGYMNPTFWDDIPVMMNGLTAFICSEEKLGNLFQGKTFDAWEMADELSAQGCEVIIIKRSARGQLVYERSSHSRWIVPAYPAHVRCPNGAGDSFSGGFSSWLSRHVRPTPGCIARQHIRIVGH